MIGSDTNTGEGIGLDDPAADLWLWNTILRAATIEQAPFAAGQILEGMNEPIGAAHARRLNELYPADEREPRELTPAQRVRFAPRPILHSIVQASRRENGMQREGTVLEGTNHALSAYEAQYLNVMHGYLPPFKEFTP